MPRSRIFGIKKSLILCGLAYLFFMAFIAFIFVSIFLLHSPVLWFYGFCLFFGVFELAKSAMFKFDSSLYLGSLLLFVGTFGFLCTYLFPDMLALFVALSFILASLITYIFTRQNFHLVIAYSIFFVTTFWQLFSKNLISTANLLAFVLPFLVLLILEMIWLCFHKS